MLSEAWILRLKHTIRFKLILDQKYQSYPINMVSAACVYITDIMRQVFTNTGWVSCD